VTDGNQVLTRRCLDKIKLKLKKRGSGRPIERSKRKQKGKAKITKKAIVGRVLRSIIVRTHFQIALRASSVLHSRTS
jgi:hypothetical protein